LAQIALYFVPIGRRREDHSARALHRLGGERRNPVGTEFENLLLQLAGDQQPERVGIDIAEAAALAPYQ